jgi:hypothetical protein
VPPSTGNGPCGVPETEPNDTRDTATAITAPAMFTSCIGTREDVDFYELAAPNDSGGGYYQISFTQIADWSVDVIAFNVSDNGELGHIYANNNGQDLHAYLAAAPGKKYRFSVGGFAGVNNPPARYTMKVSYTKVADAQEPNNTRETAKPITLGAPVMGYMFEGTSDVPMKAEETVDWYTVTAAAGNLTATIEMVPANYTCYVQIIDSAGKSDYALGPNDGANCTMTLKEAAAGAYRIQVRPFFVRPGDFFDRAMTSIQLPDNYIHPYKLTVTQ